jgi:hypothetical protein
MLKEISFSMNGERASNWRRNKSESPTYSLEKFRSASDEPLNANEQEFLEEYAATIDDVVSRLGEHPSLARGILREITRPDLWKLLISMNRAQVALDKLANGKEGQLALAREEAEGANIEYDRKGVAIQEAILDFAHYVDELNGGSVSSR